MSVYPIDEMIQKFRTLTKQLSYYGEAIELMAWDLRTGAPRAAAPARAETIGGLSEISFRLGNSEEMEQCVQAILTAPEDQVDAVTRRMAVQADRSIRRSKQIPPDQYKEYVILTSEAESVWEEAKAKKDFTLLAPYLEKIIDTLRRFIPIWDIDGLAASHPYNVLLDAFEPGFTVEELDRFFALLQERLVPLVKTIASKSLPEQPWMGLVVPKDAQKTLNRTVLQAVGFDFERGRLDESEHPFACGLHNTDVRITTKYVETDFLNALYSTLHECGHAMYEQQIDDQYMKTNLGTGTSMGVHESQSRFWENAIGRSRSFWDWFFPIMSKQLPDALGGQGFEDFYRALHRVEPSLIRIESDELTYSLHILIRYRLEKALFDGSLAVRDLPKAWNDAYTEILGVTPAHDGEGVLQDVHWSGGAFGYFPSYAIGNVYAAQLLETMGGQIPDWREQVSNGDFSAIRVWLKEHIHTHGSAIDPKPLMERVTGSAFNPEGYIQQLTDKYSVIFDLNR